jgi:RNA polymerase sporulation-specific sigma factor
MATTQAQSGFRELGDEEMVHLAHDGSEVATECLLSRYRPLVVAKARTYYVAGADKEDVVQEGMVGLFKAIRDYREGKALRFKPFAELCVTRQMISALKSAKRHKHELLTSAYSLNQTINDDEGDVTFMDSIADDRFNPESVMFSGDELTVAVQRILKKLSPLEVEVLRRYALGETYREIGDELHCPAKCIDNAIQRVKKKMGSSLIH